MADTPLPRCGAGCRARPTVSKARCEAGFSTSYDGGRNPRGRCATVQRPMPHTMREPTGTMGETGKPM